MKKNKLTLLIVILLLGVTGYFIYTNTSGTIRKELRDFAVQDTASITKIFLADKKGNKTSLERTGNNTWMVNGKYPALPASVKILLETIKKVEVRSPVGKAAFNNVIKDIGTAGTKVEIYSGDRNIKTYYVGHPTQDMLGTFMFIENSTTPFITHIPGFDGYLSTRYTASSEDWRSKIIIAYSDVDVKSVVVKDPVDSAASFKIERTASDFKFFKPYNNNQPVEIYKSKIAAYLNRFARLGYEFEEKKIKQTIKDSILATTPYKILEVTNTKGNTDKFTFYRKPTPIGTLTSIDQETGNLKPFDVDRAFVLWNNDTNFYALQYFSWGPVLKSPDLIKGFGE